MIKILHLTDFHLNKKTLNDWELSVKNTTINKLKEIHLEKPIDLIAFTGDLIDVGGKEFGGATQAFQIFNVKVIEPIIKALNLSASQFFICCGNHDIVRDADGLRDELGSKNYFTSEEVITNFIIKANKTNSYEGIKRIEEYKKFEYEFYKDVKNKVQSIFESSFKLSVNGLEVGISLLNSSWRCFGKGDFGSLLIGEQQLSLNLRYIKDCDLKIALIHHPLDWFSDVEKKIISGHITKDFDIVLFGHVHESSTTIQTGFNGTLFINVAPSGLNDIRSDSRTFSNGFSIVERDIKTIKCTYWRYNHEQKKYVLNTDAGDQGIFEQLIPAPKSKAFNDIIQQVLQNIREDHFCELDEHFIGVKAEVSQPSIKDSFVLPPINQGLASNSDVPNDELTLQEVTKTSEHIMFFGAQESGKTSLLYRLIREYVDEFNLIQKIPAYIPFDELGNKEINTAIREYLRCSSDNVKTLITENKLVLLIDNLNYSDGANNRDRINRLHRFKKENPNIQIIATAENDIIGFIPPDHMQNCKIGFNYFYIGSLRSREIKIIMKQWLPGENELKADEKLEKLVNTFRSYSLPNTAMSVSLYLWSLENREKKPINQAVLMEIYIELLLEKLSKENIYRDTFDFLNKMQLIAKIAHEMLIANRPNYTLSLSEFTKVIEEYLNKLVGFHYDPQVIISYLFKRKMFVKTSDNLIKFPYQCFFHFFIAKRMEYDLDFKNYILEEDRYFRFPKQIDYYTGLKRSDIQTFKLIFDRFETFFEPLDFILKEINIDEYFLLKKKDNKGEQIEEPIARNIEIAKIKENRPTEDNIEKAYDEQLKKIGNPSKISSSQSKLTHDRLLLIMCNVLRNSEGIEDLELKKRAYRSIIKANMSFAVLYTQWLIRYVLEHEKMPSIIPANLSLDILFHSMPYQVQHSLTVHMGTSKLSNVILSKIKDDASGKSITKSDIEAFLSVALYSDIQAPGFDIELKSFVKRVKGIAAQNNLFYKIVRYYYRRTKPGSPNESLYLDLLAELRIRTQNLSKRLRERIIKDFKDQKQKFLNSWD